MLKLFWLHGMWLDAQEIKFWIKVKKKKKKNKKNKVFFRNHKGHSGCFAPVFGQ